MLLRYINISCSFNDSIISVFVNYRFYSYFARVKFVVNISYVPIYVIPCERVLA